jgi:ribosome-associated protein
MLDALAEDVNHYLRNNLKIRGKIEGIPQDGWIVIDYGNIVVHLFSPERRNYYRLEELWENGKILLQMQ